MFFLDTFLQRPSIYLTVNPTNRNIDINWLNLKATDAENATIFITSDSSNPFDVNFWNLIYNTSINSQEGRHSTDVKHNFTHIDETTECYSYWYFYVVNEEVKINGCLRAHPNWMSKMKSSIKGRKVRELFIPGSHDSASYKRNFDPVTMDNLISKYSLTQDDDIRSQLLHGENYAPF